jgi:hypothetical protein
MRTHLTSDTTFYVSTTGSNSNDGLTVSTPWLTRQHAFDVLYSDYDLGAKKVVIQHADGVYTDPIAISGVLPGLTDTLNLALRGNLTTPDNCKMQTTTTAVQCSTGARLFVEGFAITTTSGSGFATQDGGTDIRFRNVNFMACADAHFLAAPYSRIKGIGNYKISGGATTHLNASQGQVQIVNGVVVTIVNNPLFNSYFALAIEGGLVNAAAVTFSGTARGQEFGLSLGGQMYTGGTHFPGNAAGYSGPGCYPPY